MIYTVTFNPAIDYVVRLDRELQVGDVNRARGEDCVLGGKGINVSGVLAQLGCESVALGFVAGETGAWLERGLAAQGLKTDFVHLDHGMTRINVKIKAGQETELNGAGPDIPEAAMQALEQKLDALQKDDILVLAGSIPASLAQTTYERLLAGNGIQVTNPVEESDAEVTDVIEEIRSAVIDGNTWYYLRLKGEERFFALSAGADARVVLLDVGDRVTIGYQAEDTGEILGGTLKGK